MMETQTNNHYSIPTIYGLGSRELDERCKEHVTLLLPWRPLVQSQSARSKIHIRYAKDQEKIEEREREERKRDSIFSPFANTLISTNDDYHCDVKFGVASLSRYSLNISG